MNFLMVPGHNLGGPAYEEPKRPYEDGECRHARRFNNRGIDTCKDCGATYNETTLEWENK
jgi:hypothetical protein